MRYPLRVGKPRRPRQRAAAGGGAEGAGALLPAIRQDERDEREGSEGKRWKGEGQKGRKGKNREDREQTSAFQNPLKTKRAPGEMFSPAAGRAASAQVGRVEKDQFNRRRFTFSFHALLKGVPRSCGYAIEGPLATLSLTPIYSLRHRLVRSRQSTHEDVAGFLRF